MSLKLQIATEADLQDLLVLRRENAEHLAAQEGKANWKSGLTEKGVVFEMRRGTVFLAREANQVVATLCLSLRKPWAIDVAYFSASKKPAYLTTMAVLPSVQRTGVGRRCLEEARRIATEWGCDAIRLDAYDSATGAGPFYKKCGYREVGRASYRRAPLIYFEMLL